MATESRRRWVVPALLLGAGIGTWVIVRRRSAAEPVDVWAPRPPVERMIVPPPAPEVTAPEVTAPEVTAAEVAAHESSSAPPEKVTAPVNTLLSVPTPSVSTPATPYGPGSAVPLPDGGAPEPTPYGPGSAVPLPDGGAPGPEYTIKGNGSSRLFHPPSSPYYGRTRAEVWFRTADDAVAAGFSPYRSRRR